MKTPNKARVPARRTDAANAERLATWYGNQVRWLEGHKTWATYRDGAWRPDSEVRVVELLSRVARRLRKTAAAEPEGQRRDELWEQARLAESANGVRGALYLAKARLAVRADELDPHDMLLNCTNGTLNLSRYELGEHRPDDLITRQTNAAFSPGTTSRNWGRLLRELLPDREVRHFFLRCLGLSITGRQLKHFVYVFGPPDSGKTTVLEAIAHALGTYAASTDPKTFLRSRGAGLNTPELARLPGVRMVLANEFPAAAAFDSALVKRWTGGDQIEAMAKYKDPFTFRAQGTLWCVGNVRPAIDFHEKGMWRRVLLLPFEQSVPPERQDPKLAEKLRGERAMSAIVNDAVKGLRDLEEREWKLDPPESVIEATEGYRRENDPLGDFFSDCFRTDPEATTPFDAIHAAYTRWALQNQRAPLSKARLGQELKDRGYEECRVRVNGKQKRGRRGLTLVE